MSRIHLIAAIIVCAEVLAQQTPYESYAAQIEALQRDGADLAQTYGRDYLINQYRALIDEHPGFANNIQLETQIAMLYESDFVDRGEPANMQAAYDTYQRIIDTYDPDHPYMMNVRRHAAVRATELDPEAAVSLYEGIINDYPEEDALVVESYYSLGKIADKQGDRATAQRHYDQVLNYTLSGAPLSEAQQASIDAYQANAVASTLANVLAGHDTPQARMKALKKYVEKHKELMSAHADIVQRFSKSIEASSVNAATSEDGDTLTVPLNTGKKKQDGAARKDERTRVRELRARDAAQREYEELQATVAKVMPPTLRTNSGGVEDDTTNFSNAKAGVRIGSRFIIGLTAAFLVVASIAFMFKNRAKG